MDKKNNFSTRQQSHPHKEGQMDNVTPQKSGAGQRVSENKSQAMGDIHSENKAPNPGRRDDQKNEKDDTKKKGRP